MKRKTVLTFIITFLLAFVIDSPAHANVILRALVINPSKTKTQSAALKAYLPKEVKPEDIIEMEDLKVDYDVSQALYYVYKVYELKPGESITKKVTIKDVWVINEEELTRFNEKAKKLKDSLKNTSYAEHAQTSQLDIETKTAQILTKQLEAKEALPQAHIAAYRDNVELLNQINTMLAELDKLVFETQAVSGVVVDRVSVKASWWVILGVIIALGLLSLFFFVIWHGQAVKEKEKEEETKEETPV